MAGLVRAFHGYWYNASFGQSLPELLFDLGGSAEDRSRKIPQYGAQKLVQGYERPDEIGQRAARWMEEQVLLRDPLPALYPYWCRFPDPLTGSRRTVRGLFALLNVLEAPILPHEATLPERLQYGVWFKEVVPLQTAPIQILYNDPQQTMRPWVESPGNELIWEVPGPEGVLHRMGRVTQTEAVSALEAAIAQDVLLVADGHHRLAAHQALARKGQLSPYQLVHLVNSADEGPAVLPYHRLVWKSGQHSSRQVLGNLRQNFRVKIFRRPDPLMQWVNDLRFVYGLIRPQADYLLLLREKIIEGHPEGAVPFEVDLLHEHFLEHCLGLSEAQMKNEQYLRYTPSEAECRAAVRSGKAQMALLLKGLSLAQIRQVSLQGQVLPQKATFFYPKVAAGLIFAGNANS